ncbi:MAG: uroporphyrinogen decarboxylase [Caulobacteraceae bacterium]
MDLTAGTPKLLRTLAGERTARPPIWLMRQAGRYLPEYRALRETAPDFIAFCLDPEKAAEATLQPMRRFPLDGSIVFADILLIPRALGQDVWFEVGEGPRLGALPEVSALRDKIEQVGEALSPVGETLSRVRSALEPDRTLLGFAGAPWTVLTYMLEGRSSDRTGARTAAYADPERIDALLDVLVEATWRYLAMQVKAGAQALVLFESWAEGLSEDLFQRLVVQPHQRLLVRLRAAGVEAPVIGFPRGGGALVEDYAEKVEVQGVALDTQASAELGRRVQAKGKVIQGALDPLLLRAGGPALEARVGALMEQWSGGPHIFNLGHGVLPDTPVSHVEQVIRQVTGR